MASDDPIVPKRNNALGIRLVAPRSLAGDKAERWPPVNGGLEPHDGDGKALYAASRTHESALRFGEHYELWHHK